MRVLLLTAALALPGAAQAVSSNADTSPPAPSETTQTCEEGTVWSPEAEACVAPEDQQSGLDDDARYRAARELAWAGRLDDARRVLDAMDPADDRVLTYRGFIARRQGEAALADRYYRQALARNPGNLLARSYRGLGLLQQGRLREALAELSQIRARGGAGSWPERALAQAIAGGAVADY
jgi:predicted Zn-dependent protease